MNDDILALILQAENEYQVSMKNAVTEAENYAGDCKQKQNAYIEDLNQEWHLFEKSENDKLAEMLAENEKKLEAETAELKERLNISQKNKADTISGRLKREVISLYGDR